MQGYNLQFSPIVKNEELNFTLIFSKNAINGFKNTIDNFKLNFSLKEQIIIDVNSNTQWDLRGKYIKGTIHQNLEPIIITDEYWFAWKKFHSEAPLINVF